ncbi:hypothetical protein [Virgibacillus sp. SK37]|uniref:hypothetical protein n=1 Tax=Virgibacillus sp. SK37 TaxID=403957 RepID=UPI0004D11201|nr:hypothetical protein [Virgibacillus sp. SK37]AIF45750.1 hypothetical protein X953_19945 [Virgibacillus sp. SK37]
MKKKSNFLKNLFLPALTISIIFFLFVPNVFADSISLGESLSETLIDSKDPINTWNEFSDSEKEAIKSFSERGKSKITELEKKDLNSNELNNEILSLTDDVQKAIFVSLLPVNEKSEVVTDGNNITANYNVTQRVWYEGIWGNKLAQISHNILWSASGSTVTSGSRSVFPDTPGLGWSYKGLIRDENKRTSSAYSSDIQGSFSYNVGAYNVQNWYPRSQIVGYSNGTYKSTTYN